MSIDRSTSRFYGRKKRDLVDNCNICGVKATLSYDHVPPKCCFNGVKAMPLETLAGEEEKKNPYCTQNGVKFRTICKDCNNSLLGKYDKALEEFVKKILDTNEDLGNALSDERPIEISVRINALAKAICGHFLSMKSEYDDECVVDQELRKYVLTPEAMPPQKFRLLMWYYPFSTVFMLRDVAIPKKEERKDLPDGVLSVLSSFPASFILSEKGTDCGLIDLFEYCTENEGEVVTIPFRYSSVFYPGTKVIRDVRWPCNISDDKFGVPMIIGSKDATEDSVFANRDKALIQRAIK